MLNVKTGTLRRSIRGVVTENESSITALVDSRAGGGAPVVYAAIHEYGGIIRMKARSQTIYHRLSGGEIKPRFVKKSKSNFARNVDVAAHTITISNQPMGAASTFKSVLSLPYNGQKVTFTLNACISTKMSFQTALEDFTKPQFDFDAFADSAGILGTISVAELS